VENCLARIQSYTILYLLNAMPVAIDLSPSFTDLRYLTILGEWASAAHMFMFTPLSLIGFCICLKCLFTILVVILNPRPGYARITCSIDVIIVLFFMCLTSSAVPKCILQDLVMTNGILLMNIISIAHITFLCLSMISGSMSSLSIDTCSV